MENNNQAEIDPKKIENLNKILAVFDTERLTSKDFVGAFKQVIEHVKNTQNLTVQHLQAITTAVNDARTGLSDGNKSEIAALREEITSTIVQKQAALEQSHADALARVNDAIAKALPGKDADEDVIVEKVLAKIPPPPVLPIGEDFRNSLEALQGDDRLDKSAIRGFDDLEKKVNNHSVVIGNNPGTGLANSSGNIGRFQYLKFPGATITTLDDTATINVSGAGSGTVTSASVVSANGFSGSVATATTTPAITLTTTVTGVLKGNGTAISAAANSDLPTMTATVGGAVPTPPNNTTTFLRGDGTFAVPPSASGGIVRSVNVVSTNTAAGATAATDYVYYVSGASTLTLPSAIGNSNMYRVMRTGTSTVPIATTSSQLINGAAAPLNLITQYASVDLQSDGSNWFIH